MGTSASRGYRGRETPPGGWAALRSAQVGTTVVMLRPAQIDDLDSIVEIERESFSDAWSEASFRSLLGRSEVCFVVATCADDKEEEVIGYIVATFAADQGEVANLAVRPELRRSGHASRMLDFIYREAVRRAATSIWLEVRESNQSAIALYTAHGYRQMGRRARYYDDPQEDALVLSRNIYP
ncbi:MAG TPA: ribosomal protein S18-alanine N-acetyltransferase [Gemmatimonadaceae bacterium]|nr:ribosomal protein S18-alanine N-acetyltransferase [Gemmatimonadaceae bacterium]